MTQQHQQTRTARGEAHASQNRLPLRGAQRLLVLTAVCCCGSDAFAFRVTDVTDALGLGIVRWNADPHLVDGVERSLDGGLRYSIEGGSYAAFRDQITWTAPVPTVAEFQTAVEDAFADWEAVDPGSGLGTDLYFVPDFDTPIFIEPIPDTLEGRLRLNRGAEIDITSQANLGSSGRNETFADLNSDAVTLTSGIQDYPAAVYSGSDIKMNTLRFGTDPWLLEEFRQTLSHEIGHALGLSDVDFSFFFDELGVQSFFYDDNYDDTSDATALATLTNSFADLIDPFDPNNSPALMLYEPCSLSSCVSSPGLDSPGVNIHMESSPTGGDPRMGPQNDDFAGRQFLYPYVAVVPEPSSLHLLCFAVAILRWRRKWTPSHCPL